MSGTTQDGQRVRGAETAPAAASQPDGAQVARLLPMSPNILVDMNKALSDGTSGAAQLSKILKSDPGLVATILRLVNSAYFGLPYPIQRPTAAIAYLGVSEVHRLVVTASIINGFEKFDRGHLEAIWRRSALAAITTRELVRSRARWLSSSTAWTLGLLHDLGSLATLAVAPDALDRVTAYCEERQCLVAEAEVALGLPSATDFANVLCHEWRLPWTIEVAATQHRSATMSAGTGGDDAQLLTMVFAAVRLATLATRNLRPEIRERLGVEVRQLLGCGEEELWDILARVHAQREEAEACMQQLLPKAS
ncbi:MAG: HDOD domain-containing protein [Myxococcales bacterium]|nr:HDOD domain-containing protein [Myxococcales bacterium]MCB9736942.1 HDOD domain-containing protein [Deltaproteobacteria bacterium]